MRVGSVSTGALPNPIGFDTVRFAEPLSRVADPHTDHRYRHHGSKRPTSDPTHFRSAPNTPNAAATTPPSRRTRPELARSRPSDTPDVNPPPSKAFSRTLRANSGVAHRGIVYVTVDLGTGGRGARSHHRTRLHVFDEHIRTSVGVARFKIRGIRRECHASAVCADGSAKTHVFAEHLTAAEEAEAPRRDGTALRRQWACMRRYGRDERARDEHGPD